MPMQELSASSFGAGKADLGTVVATPSTRVELVGWSETRRKNKPLTKISVQLEQRRQRHKGDEDAYLRLIQEGNRQRGE